MGTDSPTSANSAAGNGDIVDFTTFKHGMGRATGGQHTPTPTSPNPILIQQGKKRSRLESDDDGYEPDSESEVRARKTNSRRISYQLKRHFSEESFLEERPAKRMRRIVNVISVFDRLFGGCPHSSTTSISVDNSCGPCESKGRNTSTSTSSRRMSKSRRRRRSRSRRRIMSRYISGSMSGSTGTAVTGTLSDESPICGYPLDRYLNESPKDGGPILPRINDKEGQAIQQVRKNGPPGMLFLVLFFVLFFALTHKLWAYGITVRFSFDHPNGIVHPTFCRL